MLMDDDRLDEAARVLRLGRDHSHRLGAVANIPAFHFGQGVLGFLSGTWDAAIAELAAGLLAAADIGSVSGLVWAQSIAAIIAVHSDDLVGAAAALASAEAHMHAEIQPFWHWSLWARALLREAQGDVPGAAGIMAALVDGCTLAGSLYELVELAPDMVRMSMAIGARDRALPVVASVSQAVAVAKRDNGTAAALRCQGLLDGDPDALDEGIDHLPARRAGHECSMGRQRSRDHARCRGPPKRGFGPSRRGRCHLRGGRRPARSRRRPGPRARPRPGARIRAAPR